MNSSHEPGGLVVTAMDVPQLLVGGTDHAAAAAGARAAGFTAGYAEGLRQATQQANHAARELRERERVEQAERAAATRHATTAVVRAAQQLGELSDGLVATMADLVTDEVVSLAEAVLLAELSDPGHRAAAALRRAMSGVADRVGGGHRVSVRLNPADIAALGPVTVGSGVEIIADTALAPGDAAAVSGDRWVEASIRDTLHRVREAVAG